MFRPIATETSSHMEMHKENAIEKMFKSIHHSFLYYFYRFFGPKELRSAIRIYEKNHDQVLEHELEANISIYKIQKASVDQLAPDSNIFLLKTAFDQLTQNKNVLEDIHNNSNINENTILLSHLTSDIDLIDKQLLALDKAGRAVGVELNVKMKLSIRNEEKYKHILSDLSSVEIHSEKTNIARELIKKGVSIVSIIQEEIPHRSNSYAKDVKDDKTTLDHIEAKLIHLYKALDTIESSGKKMHDRLLALRERGIDPSVILYKLVEEVENEHKPDHLISSANRENTIIRVLVSKFDMTIDRLITHYKKLNPKHSLNWPTHPR